MARTWMMATVVAAALGVGADGARAQDAAAVPKVGFVNLRSVMERYEKTADKDKDLTERSAKLEQRVETMVREKNEMESKLRVLAKGTEHYRDQLRKLYEKEQNIEFEKKWTQSEAEHLASQAQLEIFKDVLIAVETVAKQKGVGLVLKIEEKEIEASSQFEMNLRMNIRTVLYHDAAQDLSEAVLAKLNETYRAAKTSGGVKPAEKPADKPADKPAGAPAGAGAPPGGTGTPPPPK